MKLCHSLTACHLLLFGHQDEADPFSGIRKSDNIDVNRAHAHNKTRRHPMSVAKVIEISAESPKSFEEAIQDGITRASKTIHNIKSAWVKEQHVVIDKGKVALYRVDLKVTFVLD